MRAALAAIALTLAAPAAGDPLLGLPIACDLDQTCHIQQYVDTDPGPGAEDYRCGGLAYDGHKGTDFAVPTLADMARGVGVLAAAPGVVAAVRDGMPDTGLTETTAGDVDGRECGNGVLIRHGDGWETQYCHMRSGSIRVAKGDRVARGTPLGLVGQSGMAQFPHVHLSVRHDGAVVDPFAPAQAADCGGERHGLWQTPPAYRPGGLIQAGFADAIPDYGAIKAGTAAKATMVPQAPALVLYGYAFGGRKGDIIRLTIEGPQGRLLTQEAVLEKDQAQFFRAAGKRLDATGLHVGQYTGTVTLLRAGAEVDRKNVQMTVP